MFYLDLAIFADRFCRSPPILVSPWFPLHATGFKEAARGRQTKAERIGLVVQESIASARVVKAFAPRRFRGDAPGPEKHAQPSTASLHAPPRQSEGSHARFVRILVSADGHVPSWLFFGFFGSCCRGASTAVERSVRFTCCTWADIQAPSRLLSKTSDTFSRKRSGGVFERNRGICVGPNVR